VLWDQFLNAVGYFPEEDGTDPFEYVVPSFEDDHSDNYPDNLSDKSVPASDRLNCEYEDHPVYHQFAAYSPLLLRQLSPDARKDIPERFPKFMESVSNFFIQHRLGHDDMVEFEKLLVDDVATGDMSDEEWLAQLHNLIGMVPKLWGQLQEIAAVESGQCTDTTHVLLKETTISR